MSHDTHETAPTQLVQVGDVQFAYRRFGRRGGVPLLFFNYFAAPTARHRYGPSTSAIPLERETAFPFNEIRDHDNDAIAEQGAGAASVRHPLQ